MYEDNKSQPMKKVPFGARFLNRSVRTQKEGILAMVAIKSAPIERYDSPRKVDEMYENQVMLPPDFDWETAYPNVKLKAGDAHFISQNPHLRFSSSYKSLASGEYELLSSHPDDAREFEEALELEKRHPTYIAELKPAVVDKISHVTRGPISSSMNVPRSFMIHAKDNDKPQKIREEGKNITQQITQKNILRTIDYNDRYLDLNFHYNNPDIEKFYGYEYDNKRKRDYNHRLGKSQALKPPTEGSYAYRNIDDKETPHIDKRRLVASIESLQTNLPESHMVRNQHKVASLARGQAPVNDPGLKSGIMTKDDQSTGIKYATMDQLVALSDDLPTRNAPSSHKLRHEVFPKGNTFGVEVPRERYLEYINGGGSKKPFRKNSRPEKTADPYEYFEEALHNDYYKFDPVPKYADGSYLERIEKQHLQYLNAVDKRLKKFS